MNKLTKHFISILFTIVACLSAGSAGAQAWGAYYASVSNPCMIDSSGVGTCSCPQGYTYGVAYPSYPACPNATNCTYDCAGSLCSNGCWNPDNNGQGTCQECGYGGTVGPNQIACFGGSSGQANWNGASPSLPVAGSASCTTNADCAGYGAAELCAESTSSFPIASPPNTCSGYGGYYSPSQYANGYGSGGGTSNGCSDIRLKRDIVLLGQTDKGIRLYSFKYLSSDQVYVGVMAQDLLENPKWQDAVITNPNGYYSVIYSKLGLEMVTLEHYQQVSAVALLK